MILLRRSGVATGRAVQITTLLVGQLLLARLDGPVVVSTDQTLAGRLAPLSIRAGLGERVADRRQLIGDGARRGFIDPGAGEIVLGDLVEAGRDGAARGRRISAAAAPEPGEAGDASDASDERHEDRGTSHPAVFVSALVRVKEV
jgi:hypothetical protein